MDDPRVQRPVTHLVRVRVGVGVRARVKVWARAGLRVRIRVGVDGGSKGGGGVKVGARGVVGAKSNTRLVSERGMQPGYLLTGCVQSGSNTA